MLYNVENWAEMSTKKLENFTKDKFWSDIMDNKASNIHRRFLKYILGVSKSCPNSAVMGDVGELPLILKGYRLMLQYWYRITNLPNGNLAKISLLENIGLKTNWITTIEKLLNVFNLSNSVQNGNKLKYNAKQSIHTLYVEFWKKDIANNGRLEFYRKIKNNFNFEKYLELQNFYKRKAISKLRCSDHQLEIEKGRHKGIGRQERLCEMCHMNKVESEEHFLFECSFYKDIRIRTNFNNNIGCLFEDNFLEDTGNFILSALDERADKKVLASLITNFILLSTEEGTEQGENGTEHS